MKRIEKKDLVVTEVEGVGKVWENPDEVGRSGSKKIPLPRSVFFGTDEHPERGLNVQGGTALERLGRQSVSREEDFSASRS